MYYLGLVVLVISTVFVWIIKKDIWFPGIMVGLLWTFVYILLISTSLYVDYSSTIYLYVSFCVIVFEWVSVATSFVKIRDEKKSEYIKCISYRHIDLTIAILVCCFLAYIINVALVLLRNFSGITAIVFTLKYAQVTGKLSTGLIPYVATFSFVFTSFLIYITYNSEERYQGFLKSRMKFTLVLSLLYAVFLLGRVFILQWAIASLGMFVFSSHIDKEKVRKLVIRAGIALLVLFILYGISKFFYRLKDMSIQEMIDDTISVYVAGPLVGMQLLLNRGIGTQRAKATFDFFYSFLNIFGVSFQHYNRISYMSLGPTESLYGNVYTAFYYWIVDYGYIGTFILYQIFSILHTRLYLFSKKKKTGFYYTLTAFAMYPLLMQFFDEQYLTQISLLIQILVWSNLIYKTNLYIVERGKI